jgi:transketolase
MNTTGISDTARRIRREIIEMAYRSGGPHVGSALSCADIMATLYDGVLRLEPWEQRDIFILSKAHAAMSLYAALAIKGILDAKSLESYCRDRGALPAHLDRFSAPGIECSAGSLGHGLNIGLGMAYGFNRQRCDRRVFILIGDGESQEGSVWEGALFAPRLGLGNVTVIMDYNNLQGYGRPREICGFEPVQAKWEAFGWQVVLTDGHDCQALLRALTAASDGRPRIVIANTVKGKGVSFMEDQLIWHYYTVTTEHHDRALRELA